MTISPVATGAAGTAAQKAGASLADSFDGFLQLLTTQLQNQDPLSPMDSNEFTQQLVQFTSVEQSIATNRNLEQLLSVMRSGQNASAVSYIGKSVEARGEITRLGETGAAWGYEMPKNAAVTVLTVFDANGKAVFQTAGEAGKGEHSFAWDGIGSNGLAQPEGFYSLSVLAVDSQGQPVEAVTKVSGVVTGIETTGGTQMLMIGGLKVRLEDVLSVTGTES